MNKSIVVLFLLLAVTLSACGNDTTIGGTTIDSTDVGNNSAKAKLLTTSLIGYSLTRSQVDVSTKSNLAPSTITLDTTVNYQQMDGFGAAITYSTAYNLLKMSVADRQAFLKQTFSDTDGYGFSYIRISIGCSDFSSTEYTCCDTPGLENFSLHSDETNYVIPILKEILAINPKVKVIGSPWTCPRWMKVTDISTKTPYNSWTGGHLNPDYYNDYAAYFVKWITAFKNNGVNIYAVTPQNEPLNPGNSSSLLMPWEEESAFVKQLAGALKNNALDTKIYVYDHNYNYDNIVDQANYPIKVYNSLGNFEGSEYVVGAAYHDYGGSNTELTSIHNQAPDKGLIFSESSIGKWNDGRNLSKRLIADMENVALGTVNQYCTAVIVWNLMLDTNEGPNLAGGCQTCFGAVDISASDYKTITKNSHYYILAHLADVVKPGAVRIGITNTSFSPQGLTRAAFRNTDGSLAIVLCNNSDVARNVVISNGKSHFSVPVPANGIVSCKW